MTDCGKQGQEVYSKLENLFADFYKEGINFFEELAAGPLKRMIFEEFTTVEGKSLLLSHKIADKIVQRYYDVKEYKDPDPFKNKDLKWRLDMLQLIFKCGLILLAANDPNYFDDHDIDLLKDVNAMLVAHPFLLDELKLNEHKDQKELNYLLVFLNYIRIAMPIIPAASNKHLLLKIVERLEGSNNHYVCGGGMKPAVRRRIRLIESEGNSPAVKRLNRKKNKRTLKEQANAAAANTSVNGEESKRQRANDSDGSHGHGYGDGDSSSTQVGMVGIAWPSKISTDVHGNAISLQPIASGGMPYLTQLPAELMVPLDPMLLQKRTDNNPLWNLIEAVEQELGTSAAPPALPPSSNPYAPIADPVTNADRLAIQTQFMGNSAINSYNESYKLAHPYAAVPSTFGPLLVPPSLSRASTDQHDDLSFLSSPSSLSLLPSAPTSLFPSPSQSPRWSAEVAAASAMVGTVPPEQSRFSPVGTDHKQQSEKMHQEPITS